MLQHYFLKFAEAIINPDDIGYTPTIKTEGQLMHDIFQTIYFWGAVVAVIVIIVAAFYYTTSYGKPEQIARAKNAIFGAVIGLVVILTAFLITNFIIARF